MTDNNDKREVEMALMLSALPSEFVFFGKGPILSGIRFLVDPPVSHEDNLVMQWLLDQRSYFSDELRVELISGRVNSLDIRFWIKPVDGGTPGHWAPVFSEDEEGEEFHREFYVAAFRDDIFALREGSLLYQACMECFPKFRESQLAASSRCISEDF